MGMEDDFKCLNPEGVSSGIDKNWIFCFWLYAASLALNLGAVWLLRHNATIGTIDYDERQYWNLADAFRQSGIGAITAERTPGFPILIAALKSMFAGDYLAVQLALTTILALSPVLVFWLVRRQIGDELTAKFASVGFLFWPLFIIYNATLYSDSTALVVFLIYLWAFPLAPEGESPGNRRWLQFCISGALLSVCMQLKPLYLIYVPFAVVAAIAREARVKGRVYAVSFLLIGCAIMTLPWSTYISLREGYLIPLSANDGETLAGGLNPNVLKMHEQFLGTAEGRPYWQGPGKWVIPDSTGYLSKQEMELPFTERSVLLKKRAYEWIKSHPKEVAYLTARKLLYMWGIYPFWNGTKQTVFGNVPLLLLIGLALLGLWTNRGALLHLALFWTLPIFSSVVSFVSWGSWRFRLPGDLGLIVLAAMLLANWKPLVRSVRRQRPSGQSS